MEKRKTQLNETTSWEKVGKWYDSIVGEEGHYYHKQIVIPKTLHLMDLQQVQNPAVLDLAAGQGILGRQLKNIPYVGIDISPSLIKAASEQDRFSNHQYLVGDVTKNLPLKKEQLFSHVTCLLAIQNIEQPKKVFEQAYARLHNGGKLIFVINHPCFRIPRQSSWGVDMQKKLQYRRMDSYATSMKIPIQTHPSKGTSSQNTLSFHFSLSTYSQWLDETGFVITRLEEWFSDKKSTGSNAKMENRSREEFPLFLAFSCKKMG